MTVEAWWWEPIDEAEMSLEQVRTQVVGDAIRSTNSRDRFTKLAIPGTWELDQTLWDQNIGRAKIKGAQRDPRMGELMMIMKKEDN